MRNRACSARAPPVAAVTRMMTAKCVGTNRKATITNMMTRALLMAHPRRDKIRGRRAPAPPVASNSSRSITKPSRFKHRMPICKLKPHVKRLRIRSNVPASERCVKTNKAEFEHGQLRDVKVNHVDSSNERQENKVEIGDGDRINEAE